MPNPRPLTSTSYAILGLLSLRPWTTYELAQQMQRALGQFWPRAESKLYEEPKKLAAHGYATATVEHVGKRPRTVYAITPAGRAALAAWMPEPSDGPVIEFEGLVRVFFAEHGSKADALAAIAAAHDWVERRYVESGGISESYLDGEGAFPERLPWLVLCGRFQQEMIDAVERWADWATATVEAWPEDVREAEPDLDVLRAMAEAADARDGALDSGHDLPVVRPPLTSKLAGFGTTIFAEMSALAVATGAINLGQGFPDTDGPAEVLEAAVAAIRQGVNQYPPGPGMPVLREAIARHQRRFYDIEVDPDVGVLVTAGATEALAAALLGMLEPGDEVIVFEPMYDSYQACIALADAHAVPVLLRPGPDGRYGFDPDELRGAVTPHTRVVLLNSPHNPTGKVFDRAELALVAQVAMEHDLWVITDEVYEHLVFPGAAHVPLATVPGMEDRTLSISSGGKTFSTTGWKIGWATGAAELVAAARTAKQFLTYVNGAPFQPAIAAGLDLGDDFYRALAADLTAKRDHLVDGLVAAGFTPYVPEATYFVTVDIRPVQPDGDGMAFCRSLPERCGVVAIPNEVFYARPEHGRHLVRFACCKRLDVLDDAAERLAKAWG